MRRFEDLKVRRFEDLKVRRFEDLKVRRFEDEIIHISCSIGIHNSYYLRMF
jgi:hypothetical protein